MHFVLGHPRSGTHLITDLLNAGGPRVAMHEAYVEASPDESFIALATDYYLGLASAGAVRQAIREMTLPAGIFIEANWKNTWVLPVLLDLFPDARFLHLVRDPRRNVIACHNLDYYCDPEPYAAYASLFRWFRAMPAIRRPDWSSLSRFGRNCAFWTESHRLALAAGRQLGDRYARIRLEEIGDAGTIERIFDFFRLPRPDAAAVRAVMSRKSNPQQQVKALAKDRLADALLPPFEDCAPALQDELRGICGEVAATLGYRL